MKFEENKIKKSNVINHILNFETCQDYWLQIRELPSLWVVFYLLKLHEKSDNNNKFEIIKVK